MAEKKLQAEEADELFVLSTERISETKKINIEIPNFLELIDGNDDSIYYQTPYFTVAGNMFRIVLLPQADYEIVIELVGGHSKDHAEDDMEWIIRKQILEVNPGPRLSHEWYRRFAKENGDVLKLEAKVTSKNRGAKDEDWKRYLNLFLDLFFPFFLLQLLFLFRSKPKLDLPKSLSSQETIPRVNKAIMADVETADFTMRCPTKTFRVHKTFLCARSPVLRAMILADMEEGRKGEVFIPDIDEDTLSAMITFIYTGELEMGEGLDLEILVRAADKYDLPGFLDIFYFKMKKEDLSNETIADLLITAQRYDSEELKETAMVKLRANKKDILSDEGFRTKMMEADPSLLLDLIKDI